MQLCEVIVRVPDTVIYEDRFNITLLQFMCNVHFKTAFRFRHYNSIYCINHGSEENNETNVCMI